MLIYYWFILAYLLFHLLYSSTLFSNLLFKFSFVFIHSSKYVEFLYAHYLELFIGSLVISTCLVIFMRFCLIPSFGTYLILLNFLCLFLCIRWAGYVSQCWRSGLCGDILGAEQNTPLWLPGLYAVGVLPLWAVGSFYHGLVAIVGMLLGGAGL